MLALREPSLGPVFGIKGGAAGGGYSQLIPMEDLNLHFTGDIHAVGTANNLLAAMIDSHLMHGNELEHRPADRSRGAASSTSTTAPCARSSTASAASSTASRARPASTSPWPARSWRSSAWPPTLKDLRERLGRITFGYTTTASRVTADDIGAGGAMTVLLKDAIKPNLMQTLEGNAALVHAGPFANIAQGNNSIIADRVALKLGRLRRHRERLRRRHGLREVHGHHLPLRRLRARAPWSSPAPCAPSRCTAGLPRRPRAAQGREQRRRSRRAARTSPSRSRT